MPQFRITIHLHRKTIMTGIFSQKEIDAITDTWKRALKLTFPKDHHLVKFEVLAIKY